MDPWLVSELFVKYLSYSFLNTDIFIFDAWTTLSSKEFHSEITLCGKECFRLFSLVCWR